jgi:hypothetical protein
MGISSKDYERVLDEIKYHSYPVRFKHDPKFTLLVSVRPKPEFIGAEHPSFSLMALEISPYFFQNLFPSVHPLLAINSNAAIQVSLISNGVYAGYVSVLAMLTNDSWLCCTDHRCRSYR